MMIWSKVLQKWSEGFILKYPKNIKQPFMWRCNSITKEMNTEFKNEFIINNSLPKEQDYTPFLKKIKNNQNKYVFAFENLSKDTILVVPTPRNNKSFAHIKQFIDEASSLQQKEFWKYVANECKKMLKKHDRIWVSTHGLGVSYLHIRISYKPKYYGTSKLKFT